MLIYFLDKFKVMVLKREIVLKNNFDGANASEFSNGLPYSVNT